MRIIEITQKTTSRDSAAFNQYLKDISQIDLLTPEEEIICTKKARLGDKDAIDELVKKNLRFVVSVAKQFPNHGTPLEDLVNEGNIGLIMAAQKFNPEIGVKFISYAVWWIQKVIMDHLSKCGKMIRLPANQINNLSALNKQINKLEQKLGRTVDIIDIIEEYGSEDGEDNHKFELLEMLNTYSIDSLDRGLNDEDDNNHSTLSDLISDDYTFKPTDHLVIDANIKSEVIRIIDTLKPRDRRIMTALYGLDGGTPMTLQEIGTELDLSRESIRQIRNKTLISLKKILNNSSIRDCQ